MVWNLGGVMDLIVSFFIAFFWICRKNKQRRVEDDYVFSVRYTYTKPRRRDEDDYVFSNKGNTYNGKREGR
jgi:hypothetical protein